MAARGARRSSPIDPSHLLAVLGAGRHRSRGDDPALDPAAARQRRSDHARARRRGSSWSARSSAASCRPASAPTRRAPMDCRASDHGGERGARVGRRRSLLGVLSLVVMAVVGLLAWAPVARERPAHACGGASASLARSSPASRPSGPTRVLRAVIPAHRHDGPVDAACCCASADAVGRYRGRRGVLAHVMAWSIVVQVLRITQAYLLGLGLGIDRAVRLLPAASCRSAC